MFTEIALIDYSKPLAQRAASRKYVSPYKWRPSDASTRKAVGFYQSSDGLEMDRHGSSIRLRLERATNLLPGQSRLPRGYCTDEHGYGDMMVPIVALLPRGRGYLAGWTMGEGMCAALDTSIIWDDAREAAYAAHDFARDAAEAECSRAEAYDAACAAGSRVEETRRNARLAIKAWRRVIDEEGLPLTSRTAADAVAWFDECWDEYRDALREYARALDDAAEYGFTARDLSW